MIRALIVGELRANPQQRTTKTGNPYAIARVSVPMGDQGRVNCSLISFEADAVKRLMELKEGATISAAGTLKAGVHEPPNGTPRPSLDLVADEVTSTTPRPRKPKPAPKAKPASEAAPASQDAFDDLPGASDLTWWEA